jgi:hypothetical protein
MSISEALSIMSEMVGSAIDGDCLDALKSATDKANAARGDLVLLRNECCFRLLGVEGTTLV